MKLRFAQPKNGRRKTKGKIAWVDLQGRYHRASTFMGVTCWSRPETYWWFEDLQKWVSSNDIPDHHNGYASHTPPRYVRSTRAFRRRLKQWSTYLPSGVQFMLVSRFDELCVLGKTT